MTESGPTKTPRELRNVRMLAQASELSVVLRDTRLPDKRVPRPLPQGRWARQRQCNAPEACLRASRSLGAHLNQRSTVKDTQQLPLRPATTSPGTTPSVPPRPLRPHTASSATAASASSTTKSQPLRWRNVNPAASATRLFPSAYPWFFASPAVSTGTRRKTDGSRAAARPVVRPQSPGARRGRVSACGR